MIAGTCLTAKDNAASDDGRDAAAGKLPAVERRVSGLRFGVGIAVGPMQIGVDDRNICDRARTNGSTIL